MLFIWSWRQQKLSKLIGRLFLGKLVSLSTIYWYFKHPFFSRVPEQRGALPSLLRSGFKPSLGDRRILLDKGSSRALWCRLTHLPNRNGAEVFSFNMLDSCHNKRSFVLNRETLLSLLVGVKVCGQQPSLHYERSSSFLRRCSQQQRCCFLPFHFLLQPSP